MHNLVMNPDIFGNNIAFVSGDSLWEYDVRNGKSKKIVSETGIINNCRYYDNGKKIAFRVMYGESASSSDIFSYDRENGKIERLTYLSGLSVARRMFTDIAGFSPDGNIIISTPAFQPFNSLTFLYEIKENGKILEPLNLGPAIHIIYYNDKIYLGRNTSEMPHWKGYRGGTRGKIWAGNKEEGFKKIVDLEYHVSSPVLLNDRIFFIYHVKNNGQICSVNLNGDDFTIHTDFRDYYPRHLNTDGKRIVFSKGGDIFIFNPENNSTEKVNIGEIYESIDEKTKNIVKSIEEFHINNEGFVGMVSRGQAFLIDENANLRVKIPDSLRIRKIHFIDVEKVIYILGGPEGDSIKIYNMMDDSITSIKQDFGNIFYLKTSKDGKITVFSNDKFELYLLDLRTSEIKLIDKSSEDMISDFDISPDSNFISYSFPIKKTFFGGYVQRFIRIYDINENRIYNLTTDISNDYSPAFSPDGNYLYFLSSRDLNPVSDKLFFNFSYPMISRPYVIPLRENGINPVEKTLRTIVPKEGSFDLENAKFRTVSMDIQSSDYRSINPTDNGLILYDVPVHGEFESYYNGASEKGILKYYDFRERKIKELKGGVISFDISPDSKKIIYRKEDLKIAIFDTEKPDNEKMLNIENMSVVSRLREEYRQMFMETWKMMKDYYWNAKRGNEIANNIFEKYHRLLERVNTRFDLSFIINEMIGEFGTSHCYEMGGEFTNTDFPKPSALAADFSYDGKYFIVEKMYSGDITNEREKSPLLTAGLKIGDRIVEIDGKKVGPHHINHELLSLPKSFVSFKIMRENGEIKRFFVKPLDDDKYVRYRAWVESNRDYVHRRSGNRIGYVHIPDMGMMGLNEFFRLFVNESSYDSLIIDVRFNGGGFVSQLIIEKIKSERLGYDKPRRGTLHPYPINSINGGVIAIANEYAGSDGDIFSHSFKQLKLGKLIGTRTWGGVVGINPLRKLIDGTVVTQPEYAFWFSNVGFNVENYGVDPDIVVEYKPEDYLSGRDPQLDIAIDILLKEENVNKRKLPNELLEE
ncbi:MAG: S41 family peptidase [Thermoplasmata archaeon]